MSKHKSFEDLVGITKKLKSENKTIGLITGCFDIVHIGHIELFRYTKKHCDYLIVGLDSDESIRLSKGDERPIYKIEHRIAVLSELVSIDYVFPITHNFQFGSHESEKIHHDIITQLNPDILSSNCLVDKYWEHKKQRAEKIGAKFIACEEKPSSTSYIAQKIKRIQV